MALVLLLNFSRVPVRSVGTIPFFEKNKPTFRFPKHMRLEFEPNVTAIPFVENEIFEEVAYPATRDFQSVLSRGIAAAQAGEKEYARDLLSSVSEMEPRCEEAWMWLASISDYPEELLACLNRVLEINPENPKAIEWRRATCSLMAKTFAQRAAAAHAEGEFDVAERYLGQALDHDPGCEMAWFWKASFAADEDERLELFGKVLAINPENAEAECAISAVRTARMQSKFEEAKWSAVAGERERAIALVDEFLAHVPDNADAWVFRSHLLPEMNEKISSLEKALNIEPENPGARASFDFLKATLDAAKTRRSNDDERVPEIAAHPTDESIAVEDYFEPGIDESPVFSSQTVGSEDKQDDLEGSSHSEQDPTVAVTAAIEWVEATELDNEEQYPAPFDGVSTLECEISEDQDNDHSEPEEIAASSDAESVASHAVDEGESALESANDDSRAVLFSAIEEVASPETETVENLRSFIYDAEPVSDAEESDAEEGETARSIPMSYSDPSAPNGGPEEQAPVQFKPETQTVFLEPAAEYRPSGHECPFCGSDNEAQALECSSCQAFLSVSDLESLLSHRRADREVVQRAVTKMEAEWNLREFNEAEMTELSIGHLNLKNLDAGFKYLQEASRLNPNNVVLASQVNTLAIRAEEIRRQAEIHDTMPKGKTILVVDDSPTVRKLISGKLEKSGHQVICAVDGVDALERLGEGLPDLVLLDITMPRMDGYEVCKQIRSNPAAKDLPVVMISGKDGFFDKVRGRMAGSTGYVTKPFGPETLMKALEMYLLPDSGSVN
jgi:twitching motility two-component system response regulator PilG